jgi:hypothetical protein
MIWNPATPRAADRRPRASSFALAAAAAVTLGGCDLGVSNPALIEAVKTVSR